MSKSHSGSRSFASDNYSGVHPRALEAIARANVDHAGAYGGDPWTARAEARFTELFGEGTRSFLVFNGTGANVLGLQALCPSWGSVLCTDFAHIQVDECGAPEKHTGAKLQTVATGPDGKLTPALLEPFLGALGVQHHSQPRVVSVTQASEWGTVYSPAEVRALAEFAHAHGMKLHMDGARLANAAAHLGVPVREFTRDAGVDALSFGGTKNGIMMGEAVVVWDEALARQLPYLRKQAMQLNSKMRFVAAQFDAMLEGGLWLETAAHANRMAALLAQGAARIPGVQLARSPQINEVFARIPATRVPKLQAEQFFYVWNPRGIPGEAVPTVEIRWVCSWDTTEADVRSFLGILAQELV